MLKTIGALNMPVPGDLASAELDSDALERPTRNAAVARCIHAWRRAYNKKLAALDNDESDYPAEKAGNEAYLRAMPSPAGYENVCDFIACVTYAAATGIVQPRKAEELLAAAKVALGALRWEARTSPKPKKKATA